MIRPCLLLAVVFLHLDVTSACNGYSAKVNHVKNCVDNPVIKLPTNPTVTLDSDCNLVLVGCVEITKPFKTAKGTYTLKKAPLPAMEGDIDFCEMAANIKDPGVEKVAAMFGMPKSCPVPKKKVCSTDQQKISIAKYKNQIGMASGTSEAKVEITHDTGKSCIDVSLTVSRARKG